MSDKRLMPYVSPAFQKPAFNCPHCHTHAQQSWGTAALETDTGRFWLRDGMSICVCNHCNKSSVWVSDVMVFPLTSAAPTSSPDMPADVAADFEEARQIAATSPRGAAALLRLAIQKLCKCLGVGGKDLNDDIGLLVRQGLPMKVQQALDVVRVIGNYAVHPGQLDVKDDPETVARLFELVNIIVDCMITQPQRVSDMFAKLPEQQLKGIAKRDGTKHGPK